MIKSLGVGISALLLALGTASAATLETDQYTVTYDDSTVFGGISSWSSGGSSVLGLSFQWTVPSAVNAVSTGSPVSAVFDLPSFTIAAKSGWALSNLGGFLGNLTFTNGTPGAETSVEVAGAVAVDGGPSAPVGGFLARTVTLDGGSFKVGYFSGTGSVPGAFESVSFSGGTLTLFADAGGPGFASIVGQPQNELEISFQAAPVPEPGTWAMMLAGAGLMGGMVVRRRRQ